MTSRPRASKITVFLASLLFILGSLAMIPTATFVAHAQSCNAGEQVHTVASGENLYRIGLRYGISYIVIAARNSITDVTRVDAGTVLCIPAGANPVTDTTTNTNTTTTIVQQVIIVVTATPSPATTTQTTTTSQTTTAVEPGMENWCYTGGPWDDGRCIHPNDTALQDYFFLAGWCGAQIQLGRRSGTVDECVNGVTTVTSGGGSNGGNGTLSLDFGLVDPDDDEFECAVVYDKDTGSIAAVAEWDDDYEDQDQVIFFTDIPGFENHAVDISENQTQAGITTVANPFKSFGRASAHVKTLDPKTEERTSVAIATCDRYEQ